MTESQIFIECYYVSGTVLSANVHRQIRKKKAHFPVCMVGGVDGKGDNDTTGSDIRGMEDRLWVHIGGSFETYA